MDVLIIVKYLIEQSPDTMKIYVLFKICWVLTINKQIIVKDDVFMMVTDRYIEDYVFLNYSIPNEILFEDDFVKCVRTEEFLCDRYFPKLFFYSFDLSKLKKMAEDFTMVLKCFSKKSEIIFECKIEYRLNTIIFFEFYGADKNILNVKKYCKQVFDVFIISDQLIILNP
ncbi:hypothetical protein NBO_1049g0001 [Nosema bombycis CQ1]|uniref:Uncharacterized protein n=1 Tax=Nosema bombycis (strain CQ1 / CVCC 102059) TaxID=578461 RepID=R0KLR6_NOSB1|nr:hypothetical protein NBO_1049g0001 [Nosema bombycis CQ1]|eukprot:EOB11576.1 hypothetical protein NBO_1049g0001 [Nosema bombycis CQ1]